MNKFLLLLFFVYSVSYSQDKAMVPKKGTIVFREDEMITDTVAYKKSTGLVSQKMFEFERTSIRKEREQKGLEADSSAVNKILLELKNSIKENFYIELHENIFGVYRFYTTFNNDEIYYHCTLNNELLADSITYKISKARARNPIEIENIEFDSFFPKVKVISINEFRNETKIINGYPCFKVVYSYQEIFDDNDLDSSMNDFIQRKELWVTEKIKSPMHPVIHESEILEKYFPLEIIKTIDEIEGFKTVYTLDKLDLK